MVKESPGQEASRHKSTLAVPKCLSQNFKIKFHATSDYVKDWAGVRWPPGRARAGKPPAGLGQGTLN